ncbi:hypothetical protein ABTX60_06870 [Streptomyces sp. NPDC126510]|uniref:hypothetical protein n=1 Tax=Streptomyces sp. NPDC126510 TaxID=3155317 RepID=UPI003328CC5B
MFRIIRTAALKTLQADVDAARAEADRRMQDASAADTEVEKLRTDLARAHGELAVLRTQTHLDNEDRIVLRKLLRTARSETADRHEVAVLFRRGALVSAHATRKAAQAAAAADGASPGGWTSVAPGTPLPPEADIPWQVTVLPVQTER